MKHGLQPNGEGSFERYKMLISFMTKQVVIHLDAKFK